MVDVVNIVNVINPVAFSRRHSLGRIQPSAGIASNPSASSSRSSLDEDDENDTIKATPLMTREKERSQEDLRLLAVSAQITEISYSISDIQTRIFEIQELRHQSSSASTSTEAPSGSSQDSTGVIDQALINLDERLEAVSRSVDAVEEALTPLLRTVKTPTQNRSENAADAEVLLLRKHGALMRDWQTVQAEADVLREELKEDKWLTVFRSVREQADGMMKSLEKAIIQCQDFIWQVKQRRPSESLSATSHNASMTESSPINLDVFTNIHNAFESKKKYYMPSVTKILSVVDKGVRDRVTKNGECLRLHSEMRSRWRNLRERITRIDTEMEGVRRIITQDLDRTENESTVSRTTSKSGNGFLDTPSPPRSRAPSSTSTLSRSISPFRKLAARVTRSGGRSTPTPKSPRFPATEPVPSLRDRASAFLRHKATNSVSEKPPGSSVSPRPAEVKKQPWNSSTKLEREATIKPLSQRRPSAGQVFSTPPSMSGGRSVTPSSQASSRPWSPSESTMSTPSTQVSPPSVSRPSSRAASSYGLSPSGPRARPTTPSHIPVPTTHLRSSSRMSSGWDDEVPPTSLMQRALSPSGSAISVPPTPNRATTPYRPRTSLIPRPRTPSGTVSHIPVPSLNISRPGSALSSYSGTSSAFMRAQTPEASIRAVAQQMPFYQSTSAGRSRPGLGRGPPSSFRDTSATPTSTLRSRPPSRSAFTPSLEQNPVPTYIPGNIKDPLDVEVARVVNSMAHGFLIERVDPPLRTPPKPGEEVKAQYAISNALARKILNCRLVVINRAGSKNTPGSETRKVMCRVGGGWQDLSMYLLNRAAGVAV